MEENTVLKRGTLKQGWGSYNVTFDTSRTLHLVKADGGKEKTIVVTSSSVVTALPQDRNGFGFVVEGTTFYADSAVEQSQWIDALQSFEASSRRLVEQREQKQSERQLASAVHDTYHPPVASTRDFTDLRLLAPITASIIAEQQTANGYREKQPPPPPQAPYGPERFPGSAVRLTAPPVGEGVLLSQPLPAAQGAQIHTLAAIAKASRISHVIGHETVEGQDGREGAPGSDGAHGRTGTHGYHGQRGGPGGTGSPGGNGHPGFSGTPGQSGQNYEVVLMDGDATRLTVAGNCYNGEIQFTDPQGVLFVSAAGGRGGCGAKGGHGGKGGDGGAGGRGADGTPGRDATSAGSNGGNGG